MHWPTKMLQLIAYNQQSLILSLINFSIGLRCLTTKNALAYSLQPSVFNAVANTHSAGQMLQTTKTALAYRFQPQVFLCCLQQILLARI
jgi:hypothetical protein